MGDRVVHVVDTSDQDPNARAYRNRQELGLHTDLCDVIVMLSISKAKRGGVSRSASAHSGYTEILARDPRALDILFRGFQMYRVGERGPGNYPIHHTAYPFFHSVAVSWVFATFELTSMPRRNFSTNRYRRKRLRR